MIFVDTLGRFWGEEFQPWSDMKAHPDECGLLGITCVNGKIARIDLSSAHMCSNGNKNNPGPGPISYCKGLPAEIGELSNLEVLQLTSQQWLRGSIPTEVGKLTLLRMLDFSSCSSMSGTLPSEIANLTNLKRLLVPHGRFSGTIPPGVYVPSLEKLHLTNNAFTGSLPPAIANLTNIKGTYAGLVGTWEGGCRTCLSDLSYFALSSHHFSPAPLPPAFAYIPPPEFMISRNKFTGSIPSESKFRFIAFWHPIVY